MTNERVEEISAESWLAERGYSDSRPHSSVAIAALLEEFAALRCAQAERELADAKKALKVMNENLDWLALAKQQAERERKEQGRYACEMVDEVNRAQKEERAARAEVERLKEYHEQAGAQAYRLWNDKVEKLEADLARLRAIEERAKQMLYVAGCRDDGINEEMRILWRVLGIDTRAALEGRG